MGFPEMEDLPHVLYRFYNADGDLLYVGMTGIGAKRWIEHAKRSWWPEVAMATLEHIQGRGACYRAESAAIRDEDPKYNISGKPRPQRKTICLTLPPGLLERIEAYGRATYGPMWNRSAWLCELAEKALAEEGSVVEPQFKGKQK